MIVLINYGFAMYIAYPHTGGIFQPLVSTSFNGITNALQALVEMVSQWWDEFCPFQGHAVAVAAVASAARGAQYHSSDRAQSDFLRQAILGENISLDMAGSNFAVMNTAQRLETAVYVCMLYLYIIMALILLLNLLIAMMGDTYGKVQEQAVREWRVANLQVRVHAGVEAAPSLCPLLLAA